MNAKAAAILRACSAASGVGGAAGVEVAAAAAAPAVAAEPSVTSTAINNVANAQPKGRVRYLEKNLLGADANPFRPKAPDQTRYPLPGGLGLLSLSNSANRPQKARPAVGRGQALPAQQGMAGAM